MAKIVHKQKGLFGETIYTDENFRMIGSSRKGLFGEEIILDRNGRYAGSKRKGLFGEDVYLDKDYHVTGYGRQSLLGTKVFLDKDGKYVGRTGKGLGQDEYAFFNGMEDGAPAKSSTAGGWIFLVCVLIAIVLLARAIL